jgi:molybdopterin-binding protein
MKISARNQLKGTITKVEKGAVSSIVTLDVSGNAITATISNAAVDDLGLAVGQEAYAIIKATSVMIGIDH